MLDIVRDKCKVDEAKSFVALLENEAKRMEAVDSKRESLRKRKKKENSKKGDKVDRVETTKKEELSTIEKLDSNSENCFVQPHILLFSH